MKKLEEPSSSCKPQTQIQETQIEEENIGPIYLTQTEKNHQKPTTNTQLRKNPSATNTQLPKNQITTIIQKDEIGIQTENTQNPSAIHDCCQDVSTCPCVLVS